jgi:Transcriptional regulator
LPDVKHFDPDEVIGAVVPLLWHRGWSRTGVSDLVEVTGVSRSSLYATFGSKHGLCLAALRRYLAEYADPGFAVLEEGREGLSDIAAFFGRLITARCAGPRARWGCLAANLLVTSEGAEDGVAEVLATHQTRLVGSLASALCGARALGHRSAGRGHRVERRAPRVAGTRTQPAVPSGGRPAVVTWRGRCRVECVARAGQQR